MQPSNYVNLQILLEDEVSILLKTRSVVVLSSHHNSSISLKPSLHPSMLTYILNIFAKSKRIQYLNWIFDILVNTRFSICINVIDAEAQVFFNVMTKSLISKCVELTLFHLSSCSKKLCQGIKNSPLAQVQKQLNLQCNNQPFMLRLVNPRCMDAIYANKMSSLNVSFWRFSMVRVECVQS